MFGFFKNKTKDRVANKEKNSDGGKEKKKDKANKDEKELKVNIRKGKEDKASRSIFRKSKSIEKAKEGNEDTSRKSQSLESRSSGGWSDHEELSRQDSGATESEEAGLSPGPASNSSSCEDAANPASPPSRLHIDTCTRDGDAVKPSDSLESSIFADSLTSSQEDEARTEPEGLEERKHEKKHSLGTQASAQRNSISFFPVDAGRLQHPRTGGTDSALRNNTQSVAAPSRFSRAPDSAATLLMKPPLNPRLVAPRGPLATTTTTTGGTSFQASSVELSGERDDSGLTPSLGMVTPPASPDLHSSQAIPTQPSVSSSPSRPTSPDGRASMLSTPSSSTSSLSSLTARPISPSGRRTPPGPRMGTGCRLTSSPTAGRKAVRTNIKTNPSMASRRAGSHSPVNSPPSPGASGTYADSDSLKTPPSSPVPLRHVLPEKVPPAAPAEPSVWARTTTDFTSKLVAFSPPIARRGIEPPSSPSQGRSSLPSASGKLSLGCSSPPPPRLGPSAEVKPEGGNGPAPQRSVSPTVGKARHSISSMHSLESIPENDSDGQSPVANEKILVESGTPSRAVPNSTPSSPKEQQQQPNAATTRPTRHSAPEATSERQHSHGVTYRRSSSLTPVSEERRIHFSVSISETKSGSPTHPVNEARRKGGRGAEAGKTMTENSASKRENPDNANAMNNRKEHVESSKEITHPESKTSFRKEKASSISTAAGAVEPAGGVPMAGEPVIGSLAMVAVTPNDGDSQENDTKDIHRKNCAALGDRDKHSAATDTGGKEDETATHVVFRIPLRRSSLANGEEVEKRASVEILPREAGRTKRREREHCKERPRSVSTSRELRRERTSERLSRKRLPTEGNDIKNELTTTPESEGKKEGTRERIRCRSSSSRRSRGTPDQTCDEPPFVPNGNDSYDGGDEEVIVPWRKVPRSRSQVSRAEGLSDTATAASGEPPTSAQDQGASGGGTQEGTTKESLDSKEKSPSLVTAPPRHRSKSRGPERRMTRSVTLSEIKQAGESNSTCSEQQPQRRARSSSRLQEVPRSHDNTQETDTQTADGSSAKSHAPARRKISTKSRSVSRTRKEGAGDVQRPAEESPNAGKGSDHDGKRANNKETHVPNNFKTTLDEASTRTNNPENNGKDTGKRVTENIPLSKQIVEKVCVETQTSAAVNTCMETQTSAVENTCAETQTSAVENTCAETQTSAVETNSKLCQTEVDLEPRVSQRDLEEHTRKELGAQEERYQKQIDEMTLSLAEKQEEVTKLTQTLETLKRAQETLVNSEELQEKLALLQQDVRDRNAQLDCARTELQSSKDEMELTKAKLKKIEEDLDAARQKNLALQNQIIATANCDKTEELETKIKGLEEKLKVTEEERDQLSKTIDETEAERDEEIKIIQDALDEAAQEREDLIATFQKEIQNMTTMNTTREQQLMEDFEWKLREMEKDHKKKVEERERKAESTLQRAKRQAEETEAEFRQKQEKMKNELNAEWEDKLRSECSRLKAELDELHAEEKHLAVESMKVQKEQEIRKLRQSWEQRQEEMTKEISKLKDSLTEKDAYYHKEMENMRTNADRDVWELRRKLQRLDEKNWTQQELLQEKHHEDLERLRADYKERVSDLEARLAVALKNSDEETRQQAERTHNEEMEHICEQHRISMERLREELEAEKFQAVEEARVIVSKHHEYLNAGLREQLTEATASNTQCREELEAVKSTLALREEVIKSLEEKLVRLRDTEGSPAASCKDSQSSIASSSDSTCSQGSNNSQDRLSLSESVGASIDSQDEAHKSGGSGLLGKMFGGNWFSSSKTKENNRRGSAPGKQSS